MRYIGCNPCTPPRPAPGFEPLGRVANASTSTCHTCHTALEPFSYEWHVVPGSTAKLRLCLGQPIGVVERVHPPDAIKLRYGHECLQIGQHVEFGCLRGCRDGTEMQFTIVDKSRDYIFVSPALPFKELKHFRGLISSADVCASECTDYAVNPYLYQIYDPCDMYLRGGVYARVPTRNQRRDITATVTSDPQVLAFEVCGTEPLYPGDTVYSQGITTGSAKVVRTWWVEHTFYAEIDNAATETCSCVTVRAEPGYIVPIRFRRKGLCYEAYIKAEDTLLLQPECKLDCNQYHAGFFAVSAVQYIPTDTGLELETQLVASGIIRLTPVLIR